MVVLTMMCLSIVACGRLQISGGEAVIPTPARPSHAYEQMVHDGRMREYQLYIPAQLPRNAPLLVMLHGYTDDAQSLRAYTGMDAIADRYGFGVVYPRGTLDATGKRFWQVGYDFHANESVNDEAFLVALVHALQVTHGFDEVRTYVAGMSNGGDMSFQLACRQSQVFRGVAPVVGTMMQSLVASCGAFRPLSILAVNGDADDVTLYAGDMANLGGWGAYLAVADVRTFWQKAYQCGAPTMTQIGDYLERYEYADCSENRLQFYTIRGGVHVWPRTADGSVFDASNAIGQWVVGDDT